MLAVAQQYAEGAEDVRKGSLRIAGDASYGPLHEDGTRGEGSDFNDYLGVPWDAGGVVDPPEQAQFGSLDCSGYVRMVFGYRSGMPLASRRGTPGLPRRAFQLAATAPGMLVIPDRGRRATAPQRLAAGDLVFFDAAADDGERIDHVGIYVGRDNTGAARFISSRKTADGPTLGDVGARSVLDGDGLYGRAFRAARRL